MSRGGEPSWRPALLALLGVLLLVDIALRLRPLRALAGERSMDVVSLGRFLTASPTFEPLVDAAAGAGALSPAPPSTAPSRPAPPPPSPSAARSSSPPTPEPSVARPSSPPTIEPSPAPPPTASPVAPFPRDARARGDVHARLLEHLLESRTRGVLPAPAPRKPRCGPETPGEWVGDTEPWAWRYDESACTYTIASAYDWLSAFAGKRLLVIGDSASREFAVDAMRVLLGCSRFPALRYSGAFGVAEAVGGAAGAAAAAACASLVFDAGKASWADRNVTLPVGGTGAIVELRFHWLQWPSQIYEKWWWNDTIARGDFDAAVFNSYLHVVRVPSKDGLDSEHWYAREIDRLVAALDAAGGDDAALAARLRRRFFWRATFPGEWREPHYPEFQRARVLAASAVATAKMRAAGFPVISLDKFYTPHPDCDAEKRHCVTGDGTHPTAVANVPMAWELWSVVADAMEDEAAAGGA